MIDVCSGIGDLEFAAGASGASGASGAAGASGASGASGNGGRNCGSDPLSTRAGARRGPG